MRCVVISLDDSFSCKLGIPDQTSFFICQQCKTLFFICSNAKPHSLYVAMQNFILYISNVKLHSLYVVKAEFSSTMFVWTNFCINRKSIFICRHISLLLPASTTFTSALVGYQFYGELSHNKGYLIGLILQDSWCERAVLTNNCIQGNLTVKLQRCFLVIFENRTRNINPLRKATCVLIIMGTVAVFN